MTSAPVVRQVMRWAKRHTKHVEITKPGDTPTGMWEVSFKAGGYAAYGDPALMLGSLVRLYGR